LGVGDFDKRLIDTLYRERLRFSESEALLFLGFERNIAYKALDHE